MDPYERQLRAVELESKETLDKMKTLVDAAKSEGRGLDEAEKAELDTHTKTMEQLDAKRTEIRGNIALDERINKIGDALIVAPSKEAPAAPKYKSLGDAIVGSDQYKALMSRGLRGEWKSGPIEIEGVDFRTKTLLDSTGVGTLDNGLIQADIQPGILPLLFQPLTVAALLASGMTTSSIVRYMTEKTATSGATGVAESGEKPESTLAFDATSVDVKKIATFLPVTDEMLEDVPALTSYINGRLSLFVRQEEEDQLLNGTGGDDLSGIIPAVPVGNQDIVSSVVDAQAADHVYAAITAVRDSFIEPDGIVMNNDDWAAIQLLKDDVQRYLGSGPFNSPAGPNLWGLRVVVTSAIDSGSALVGAFRQGAQIFRRGGLSVEASNSHADFFQHNKTALRCEERLALAIYRPAAFATASLSGS